MKLNKSKFATLILILITSFYQSFGESKRYSFTPSKTVSIILPENADQWFKIVAKLVKDRIEERSCARVVPKGNLKIELHIDSGIGNEGYSIEEKPNGIILISGNDERGLLYGVGKFLHTSGYSVKGFIAGNWRGTSVPEKPIRGIYMATHFYNYYQTAPIEEVERYIEDLALWGVNSVMVWYDMHHFKGFDDQETVEFRSRLFRILRKAKKLKISVGFIVIGNEGYSTSPTELQAVAGGSRGGNFPTDICPNKKGGMNYILKTKGDFLDWAKDLGPEYICIWPYDQGGCGCSDCQPWGSNGFLKCLENIAEIAKEKLPNVKIILSTWYFDQIEWDGLNKKLADNPGISDLIMAEDIPGYENTKFQPLLCRQPIIGFPEISMYNTFPWGGFGSTPLPNHLAHQWSSVKENRAGGFPYSEGIFDDINKVIYTQMYWNGTTSTSEILKEYINWEFSPEVVDSMLNVIRILEQNHHMRWWPGKLEGVKLMLDWFPSKGVAPQSDPEAERAYSIVNQINVKLPKWVQKSWRWRLVFIRSMLDAELKANGGVPNQKCIEGFKELMQIYHTSAKTDPVVKPPISRTDE